MAGGGTAANVLFTVCGPKCSLCCLVVSIWGVIMLGLLGIFFKIEAVALFEDIETAIKPCHSSECEGDLSNVEYFSETTVGQAYTNAALSCWGAAAVYLFFLALSGTFVGINYWRSKIQP